MQMKDRVSEVIRLLDVHYPNLDRCYLNYSQDYELLFATILSAQCTDDRVNIVTNTLFQKYKSLGDFASADIVELENDVRPTGFFRNKASHLKHSAEKLITIHNGVLPSEIKDLIELNGVGRKTANVVRGHIFKIPSIVVDTHVKRVSYKLGITKEKDPVKVEFDLMKKLPEESWIKYNQQVIAHGRAICTARNPKCDICFFNEFCKEYLKNNK